MWNFLKEISTNGDMQTMDVVFPASPMLLYTNPELLRLLLVPVCDHTAAEQTDAARCSLLGTEPLTKRIGILLSCALVQVLNFANNGTSTPFMNPFSSSDWHLSNRGRNDCIAGTDANGEHRQHVSDAGWDHPSNPGRVAGWLKPFMPMLTTGLTIWLPRFHFRPISSAPTTL